MAPRSKNADKHEAEMRSRFPVGTEVDVDGKKGTVISYGVNSKSLIVMVGEKRCKVPMPKGGKK